MSKTDILSYLINSNLTISKAQIAISLLLALVMGIGVYTVYRITYNGTAYSKSFAQSLVLMSVATTIIMTTIQSNLALSLGMVGSLSIIRFRTSIKDPKDLLYLFWAVSVGVSCGASIYVPVVIGSVIMGVMLILFKISIYDKTAYLLVIETTTENKENVDKENLIQNAIKSQCRKFEKQMCTMSDDKEEYVYKLSIKDKDSFELVKKLNEFDFINKVHIITYNGEMGN